MIFLTTLLPLFCRQTHPPTRRHTHARAWAEWEREGVENRWQKWSVKQKKKWIRVSHGVIKPKWLFFSWKAGNGQGLFERGERPQRTFSSFGFVSCALANIWAENTLGCTENFIRASRWTASNESRRRPPQRAAQPRIPLRLKLPRSLRLVHLSTGHVQVLVAKSPSFWCFCALLLDIGWMIWTVGGTNIIKWSARCLNVNFPSKERKKKIRLEQLESRFAVTWFFSRFFLFFKVFHHCLFNWQSPSIGKKEVSFLNQ